MNKIAKERNHICSSSQKIFAVIHEGNKSYKCEICNISFSRKGNLKRHTIIVHKEGKKQFKCDVCADEFKQKSNLNKHRLAIHEGNRFKCNIYSQC